MKRILFLKNIKVYLWLFLSVFVLFSCHSKTKLTSLKSPSVEFYKNTDYSLTQVLEKAEKSNKLVFVDFYADWCLPCQIMDEEVFNQKDIYDYINKHFISYKVDVEKANGANLKLLFNTQELPTFLFLDSSGKEIEKYLGSLSQTNLINIVKRVVDGNSN